MKLVLNILSILFACVYLAESITVNAPTNIVLPTFTSSIQYESIQFHKRAKNDSLHLPLKFTVVGAKSKGLEISLTYNNESVSVANPGERGDIYAEKEVDSDGVLTAVTINLKDSAANSGKYTLTLSSGSEIGSATAEVESAPILPVYSKPKRVLQGDALRISCRVSGYPTPANVSWFFAPLSVDLSDDKSAISHASYQLKPIDLSDESWKYVVYLSEGGTPNDTLKFEKIDIPHNGLYACNVSNSRGIDSTFLLVGVKDRWAALWPFLGIVIEVTLLVSIILVYERYELRKNPTAAEPVTPASAATAAAAAPSETTSPNGNAPNSKMDEVRLRNARV